MNLLTQNMQHCMAAELVKKSTEQKTNTIQKCQPLLMEAKYCSRAMPVQHFVNPGQLVQAVSCAQKNAQKPT